MPDPIRPIDASAVSPPLPDAPGFEHFMVDTPGLQTHVATIGDGDPVVMLHGFPSIGGNGAPLGPKLLRPVIASSAQICVAQAGVSLTPL